MKRIYLFLLLSFLAFKAKSQEFLDADTNQIKTYIATKGGTIRLDRIVQDGINPGPYHFFVCLFPKSKIDGSDIFMMTFYSKPYNKCYEYQTMYKSDKFLKILIDKFDNPKSGLTRVDKSLKWVNEVKTYEIEILSVTRSTGEKITEFVLDIHKINT